MRSQCNIISLIWRNCDVIEGKLSQPRTSSAKSEGDVFQECVNPANLATLWAFYTPPASTRGLSVDTSTWSSLICVFCFWCVCVCVGDFILVFVNKFYLTCFYCYFLPVSAFYVCSVLSKIVMAFGHLQ